MLGDVDQRAFAIGMRNALAGDDESGQICFRSTCGENALRFAWIAEKLLEPVENEDFDLTRCRSLFPDAGEEVNAGAKPITEDRGERRRRRNECEKPWMCGTQSVGGDLTFKLGQRYFEPLADFIGRLPEDRFHGGT